jgi:SAM-dependent methyltransferase
VVVSDARASGVEAGTAAGRTPAQVVWHDLECGGYRADLDVWRALAPRAGGPILDVGAGTGRVTLALAHDGCAVTAVDREQILLDALCERADGLTVETVCADARTLALPRSDYALCVMPMQTLQLLGGGSGRIEFLRTARAHVRAGGLVACAILGELEPFDCSASDIGPAPERVTVDGLLYTSRALRVAELRTQVVIERERQIARAAAPGDSVDGGERSETLSREHDRIELDRVDAATVEREARAVGLEPQPRLQVPATDEHVGSVVVVLRV